MGFPSPNRSVCVAGCVYLLWSEGEDYQAVLRRDGATCWVHFQYTTASTRHALCRLYFGAWGPGQWSLSGAQPERPLAFSKALWGPKVHNQQTEWPNITQHLLKKGLPQRKGYKGLVQATRPAQNWNNEICMWTLGMVSILLGSFPTKTHFCLFVLTCTIYVPVSDC